MSLLAFLAWCIKRINDELQGMKQTPNSNALANAVVLAVTIPTSLLLLSLLLAFRYINKRIKEEQIEITTTEETTSDEKNVENSKRRSSGLAGERNTSNRSTSTIRRVCIKSNCSKESGSNIKIHRFDGTKNKKMVEKMETMEEKME